MEGIKIEGEKKVLGVIVGLIFIIIVILAVLISLNEQNQLSTGNSVYVGEDFPEPETDEAATSGTDWQGQDEVEDADEEQPEVIYVTETQEAKPVGKEVLVMSPFQITEAYERARAILLNSQCYRMLGDVREVTYLTGLVGEKFIADLVPNQDYSMFNAIVVVKLSDARGTVFYKEYPVTIDVQQNKVAKCKGELITIQDLRVI